MLQRLWFIVGLSAGVMVPLIWAAYVLVPVIRAAPEQFAERQKIVEQVPGRDTPKPKVASTSIVTKTLRETVAVSDSPHPKSDRKSVTASAFSALEPGPKQPTKSMLPQADDRKLNQLFSASERVKPANSNAVISTGSTPPAPEPTLQDKPAQGTFDTSGGETTRPSSRRASPQKITNRNADVVDDYFGPHIIIVCSELTRTEMLRIGCH